MPRGPGRGRKLRGFTMVELAVTMALLGILFALALPSFMSWVRNSQVRSAAESLQGGIRRAQTDAVRLNQPVVLFFTNVPPATPNATAVAGGKNWAIQSITQFDKNADFLTGGTLADSGTNVEITGNNALCFNSNGRLIAPDPGVPNAVCVAGPQSFDIRPTNYLKANGDRTMRVLVAIGGQVHMCDPDRPTLSASTPDGCPAP